MSSTPVQARCTLYNIMWWSLSVTCDRYPISSNNKTDIMHKQWYIAIDETVKPAFLIRYKFREILGCIRDSKECLSDWLRLKIVAFQNGPTTVFSVYLKVVGSKMFMFNIKIGETVN